MANDYLALAQAGSPAAANPYLDMMQAERDGQEAQFRASATAALGVDPDGAARARRVAGYLGTTPPMVQAMPADAERAAKLKALSDNTAQAPTLRQRYADRDFANLAHDDSGPLAMLETAISKVARYITSADDGGGLIKTVAAAPFAASAGAAGLFRAGLDTAAVMLRPMVNGGALKSNPLQDAADWFGAKGAQAEASAKSISPAMGGILGGGVQSGIQSAVQSMGTAWALLAVAAPEIAIPMALVAQALNQGGQSYNKARDQGADVGRSLIYGASDAIAEWVTEKFLGLGGFLQKAVAGASASKLAMYEITKELPGELAATTWQNFNEWATLNPEKSVRDFLAEQPEALAQTVVATIVGGGAQIGAAKAGRTVLDNANSRKVLAEQADRGTQALTELSTLAEASRLRERDPGQFATFAQSLADEHVPALYVEARALAESGVDLQALGQALPSVAAQFDQAMQQGGDVVIPTGEFLTAGQQFAQPLLEHARTGADAMSPAEAKVYMQEHGDALQAEIGRVLEEKQGDEAFNASRDQVRDGFAQQLQAAGRTPEVARTEAAALGAFFAVQAARLGITPAEMAARYPLRVQGTAAEGATVLEQPGGLDALRRQWADAGIKSAATERGGIITLSQIVVADGERGAGKGTAAMQVLVDYADRTGQSIALSPSADLGATSRGRLVKFYKRFGFIENKGKNRSFTISESMYRPAPGAVLEQGQNGGMPADTNAPGQSGGAQGADSGKSAAGSSRFPEDNRLSNLRLDGPSWRRIRENNPALAEVRSLDDEVMIYRATIGDAIRPDDFVAVSKATLKAELANVRARDRGAKIVSRRVKVRDLLMGNDATEFVFFPPNEPTTSGSSDVLEQQARGQIALGADITQQPSIITLLQGADLSTFTHEAGHFYLEVLTDLAARLEGQRRDDAGLSDGEQEIAADANKLLAWFGIAETPEQSALDQWFRMSADEKRPHHEAFARGFEAYAFEGQAPSVELQGTFQKFRAWMLSVYKQLKALNVTLTDEVRGVMDRMLATTEQIQTAEAARNMGALFQTAEQAGMTPEQWAQYQGLALGATQTAIDNLQAKGLKDMQWLQNARGRKLKELQRRADGLRREVRAEARGEVMSQPVYRAWQFLTGKGDAIETAPGDPARQGAGKLLDPTRDSLLVAIAKLGGINRESARKDAGVHPDYHRTESGVFGVPVFRKEGGFTAERMAEQLAEAHYLPVDENGKHSLHELEQAISDELNGELRYSMWHDYARSMGEAPLQQLPENAIFGKLSTSALKAAYGNKTDAVWRKLSALRMTSDTAGIQPDVVGEAFGFQSGDEMVQALAAAQAPKDAIEALTDQRMLERFGDLATPEGLERATDEALHSDARSRFIATELQALQQATSVREQAPGKRSTVDVMQRAARAYAAGVVARLKVRDLRPGQYLAGEARAARQAAAAVKAGDIAAAAQAKQAQLIQSEAAKQALAAQTEIEKAASYFRRFDKRVKSIDVGYQDQIDQLLVSFSFRSSDSLRAIDKRKSLIDWLEGTLDEDGQRHGGLREQGIAPEIPDAILQAAQVQSYKEMTVEEVRGLRDTVQQIEHLGRLKNKLLTARAARDFEAARDEIVAGIEAHAQGRVADTRSPATTGGRWLQAVKGFGAAHVKVATWARIFDGGKDGGPVWEYFIRTANERGNMESAMRADATRALSAILAPLTASAKMGGKGVHFPSIGRSMNREQVVAMALNMGNAGNIQRMLGGEGWTIQQIQPVLQTLSAADWQAVQAVWDHFETYRPLIAAKERRVYGKEPNWVEPQAVTVQTADGSVVTVRGGYYPIKYDPLASNRAEQHDDADAAKRQLQGAYTSATTRRGFTKARADEINGRPLLYSLQGIYSGVNDVIHDLAWHEWLIDANKLLRSDKIDGVIRGHYGPMVVRQFKTWVQGIAEGDKGLQDELDGFTARLRHGVSIAGLGFNAMSAAMQPLGITQSWVRVGGAHIARGVAQYIAHPVETTRRVNEASEFMAGRARTRFRELAELRNQVEGQHPARELMSRYAYFLMMRFQQAVDVPTWLGAYDKAIGEGNGEERAGALADQAVIDSQGGGATKDLSAIERGGPKQKLFTVFYSFMNTALNVGVGQSMASTPTANGRAKLAADMLLLYTVPALLGVLLKDALTPGDPGDDEEKTIKKLLATQLDYLIGLFAMVREFSAAAKAATGLEDHVRDYSGPAGLRVVADAVTFAKQARQGEFDDAFRKAFINTMGGIFALPSAQANRTITGAQALNEGKTMNPAALVFGFQEPR